MGIDVRVTNEKIEVLGSSHFFNKYKRAAFQLLFCIVKLKFIMVLKTGN